MTGLQSTSYGLAFREASPFTAIILAKPCGTLRDSVTSLYRWGNGEAQRLS